MAQASVLVVEDEPLIRDIMCDVLADEGFTTVAAPHGGEAVRMLEAGLRPCLILLDLMMPVMSGWEFAEWLAARRGLDDVPVVVVTAHESAVRKPKPVRAKAVLAKPVDIDVLIAMASRHCGVA